MQPDPLGAAGYRNAIAHVAGPLRAGASEGPVALAADGTVAIDWTTREALVVVALRADLAERELLVSASVVGATPGRLLPPARFAPWSAAGTTLPVFLPELVPDARTAPPFALRLELANFDADGNPLADEPVPVPLGERIEVRVVEGVLGRMAYLLAAEGLQLRRTMRVLGASRRVATATGDALDRIGADLGVPRFADRLRFDPATKTVTTQTLPAGEPDPAYRRRLAAFRPLVLPNARGVAALLEAGGLGGATFAETATPFPVALRLCSFGAGAARANFFAHVRNTYLILLDTDPAANALHRLRFLPPARLDAVDAQRARLAAAYAAPAGSALAPFLADALDLAAACRQALLGPGAAKLGLAHCADPAAGSRYELGLGCDLTLPAAGERAALAAALATAPAPADPAVAAALDAMRAGLAGGPPDPAGAWFWHACGLKTVEPLDAATAYVSPTAVGPLTVEGTADVPPAAPLTLTAVRRAADDPDRDANLTRAVAATAAAWSAAGHADWTVLAPADAPAAWNGAVARPLGDPVGEALAAAGLPPVPKPAVVAAQLALLPAPMVVTVRLAPADASAVLAHDAAAVDRLRVLVGAARTAGVSSLLVLTSASDVLVVFGGYGLPGAGLNVGERGASAIRWSLVPLAGGHVALERGAGGSCVLVAREPALALAVAVSGARVGAHDPYEAALTLPAGTLLDLDGYELALNALARVCPIGTRINTWDLRRSHVDVDGDGRAEPLPPQLVRSYRWFRRARYRGEGPPGPPPAQREA